MRKLAGVLAVVAVVVLWNPVIQPFFASLFA